MTDSSPPAAVMMESPVPEPAKLELPEPDTGSLSATYPSLQGKAALVIGGATGIGPAIVRQLVWQGCRVAVLDDDADACDRLTQLNEVLTTDTEPDAILCFYCNRNDHGRVAVAVEMAQSLLGPITRLVGITPNAGTEETTPRTYTDRLAAMLVMRGAAAALAPHMPDLGGGRIVCINGTTPLKSHPGSARVLVSDYAPEFVQDLAQLFAADRIAVNELRTGWIDTPEARSGLSEDQVQRELIAQAWPDPYTVVDVARLAAYLLSDDCRFTGQAWNAGGLNL